MDTIEQRVMKTVAEQAGTKPDDIKPETNLYDDLQFDSLDALETVMAIEEEFAIEVSDEEVEGLKTVAEIIALVRKHLPEAVPA